MALGKLVAKNMKAIRLKNGLSQLELSEKSKLTVRYISQNVTLDVLERLAKGLGCSVQELIGGDMRQQKPPIKIKDLDKMIRFLQILRSRL